MASDVETTQQQLHHIVFFDGVCGLCNKFVDFLLKKDKQRKLVFTPLQGITAQRLGLPADLRDLKTVVFYTKGSYFERSDAVIEIFNTVGGFWKIALASRVLPRRFRNAVYDFVARNRIKWFGQKESCRIPTADERHRFLP